MAEDVEVQAERAANAARTAVKQANRSTWTILPIVLVGFALLTAIGVLLMDRDGPNPQITPRADFPTTTQPTR